MVKKFPYLTESNLWLKKSTEKVSRLFIYKIPIQVASLPGPV